MDMQTFSLGATAVAILIVFVFVWARTTMGEDWDEFSPSGLVLGWIPAAIIAAIAGVVAFGIILVGYFIIGGLTGA